MNKIPFTIGIEKVRTVGLPDHIDGSWQLEPVEVSLVGSPANLRKFLVIKSVDKPEPTGGNNMSKFAQLIEEMSKATFITDEGAFLKKVKIEDAAIGEEVALSLRILAKHKAALPQNMYDNVIKTIEEGRTVEIKEVVKEVVVVKEVLVKKESDPTPTNFEMLLKSIEDMTVPDSVKIGLRQMTKEAQVQGKELEDTKVKLQKETESRIRAEAKAEITKFDNVPADQDDMTDLLLHVRKSDDAEHTYEKLFVKTIQIFDNIAKDFFKEKGSKSSYASSDSYQRLRAIADEIKKDRSITDDGMAMRLAMRENPEIYKQCDREAIARAA